MGFGDFWEGVKKYGKKAGSVIIDPLDIGAGDAVFGNGLDRTAAADEKYGPTDRGNFNLPGYDQIKGQYDRYLQGVDQRKAPTLGPESSFRGGQEQLAGLLMDRAQGKNSVAEMQYRQAADLANQQQRSMIAGAAPSNVAMAMRLGSQNMGRNMMNAAGGAALARAQEAQQAALGLGGVLGQARGQDEGRALAGAQLAQNQYAIDDAARQGLLGGSLNASEAQQRGGIGYEQVQAGKWGAAAQAPTKGEQMLGFIQGAAPALFSDERGKKNVSGQAGAQAADQFLGSLAPKQFEYAKPGPRMVLPGELARTTDNTPAMAAPPGRQLGVMAQPVAQSPGAQAIVRGAGGMLGIDPTRIAGPMLAGLGRLNERLEAVEAGKPGKARSGYGRIGR